MHDGCASGRGAGFGVAVNEAVEEVDERMGLQVGFWGHGRVAEEFLGEEGDGGVVVSLEEKLKRGALDFCEWRLYGKG